MNNDVVTRIKEFMDCKSLNSLSLSRILGYKSSEKISRLFRDGNAKPSYEIIYDISIMFEINVDWLITGRGSMFNSEKHPLLEPVQHPTPTQSSTDQSQIVKMFMDTIESKDTKIDQLQMELRTVEKELVETKTKLSLYESSPPQKDMAKENTTGLCDAGNASLDTTSQKSSSLTKKAASVSAQ